MKLPETVLRQKIRTENMNAMRFHQELEEMLNDKFNATERERLNEIIQMSVMVGFDAGYQCQPAVAQNV